MTFEAVKALESREWSTETLAGDVLKWANILRWADDLFDGGKLEVLQQVACWLWKQLKAYGVSVVPYGALPYMGVGSQVRTDDKVTVIELPSWDPEEDEARGKEDNGDVVMPLGPLVRRRNYEEALDFLRIPF